MKKTKLIPRNFTAGLACLAALLLAGSASAQLTVTTTTEQGSAGSYPFTPSWTPAADSLIAGMAPTVAIGDFGVEDTNRDVLSLTAGGSLSIYIITGNADDAIGHNTTCLNYVTGGNNNNSGPEPGSLLIYTLPASAHGYNLTNITVDGGWADNGRDAQSFTVLYSTTVSPGSFLFLTNVDYNPSTPGGTAIANQTWIHDALGGVVASNVDAVEFILNAPNSENGFVGYGAITVEGVPATTVLSPVISITTSNQAGPNPFTPTWIAETPDLIAGLLPSGTNGNYDTESDEGGLSVLTDGTVGTSGDTGTFVTCGANGGTELVYTLPNAVYGTDVTNIIAYSGWGNDQRSGQYYILSYSTVSAPTTYIPITTVCYCPYTNGAAVAARVAVSKSDGSPLAKSVANIKFDFASPQYASDFNNAYQGYSEIIIQGKNSTAPPPPPSPYLIQNTLPINAQTVVGDQIVFTAAYSNFPPATLQWQQITATATNNISTGVVNVNNSGVTTSTLTLNNVQTNSSGTYRLVGLNATNGAAAPSYSMAAPLAVGEPTIMGNTILEYAGQAGPSGFYPPWTIATNLDLIFQSPDNGSGNPGTSTAGPGNFTLQTGLASDPSVLVDGELTNGLPGMVSLGWVNVDAGQSMTYYLPAGPANGYDLTNIAVYGGWTDDGRNEQEYQVLYSTVAEPAVFNSIGTFDYNPPFSDGGPSATRTTIVPVSGALAHNVYAVQFNFNLQPKNDWEGYSEITINGKASLGVVPILTADIAPLTAEDVVGSQLIMTASFTNTTSLQWKKNGTNIITGVVVNVTNDGIVTSTLTLNNLQLGDAATNGGYSLVGSNPSGSTSSRGCSVIVDQDPAPVNNIITEFAYQTSDESTPNTFGPTWSTADLTNSLIYLQDPPAIGYGTGNFNDPDVNFPNSAGGLPVLTDGNYGVFAFNGSHPAFATGGPDAGQYVIYSLGSNTNGYNITNIQIAGGWNDNGRNSQFYTISYSTVANPTAYVPLKAVAISPTFSGESVIRTTMTPAVGVLASNVYAIYVDFTEPPGVPNGYSGYSEISVFGSPAAAPPVTPPSGTVQNPSFELNVAPEGGTVATVPTYWTTFNEASIGDIGTEHAGGVDFTVHDPLAPPAAGNQFCYVNIFSTGTTGGIYQDVGALQAYTTYTLTVAIGSRADRINSPGIISLINGSDDTGTVLATGGGLPATQNTWQDYTVTYTTGPTVSGDLTIELSVAPAATIQADFDNVQLTVAPIVPTLGKPRVSGGKLVLTGTGGVPNSAYAWLTSTNLLTPLTNWTVSATGTLDATGALSNSIPINPSQPAGFFLLRTTP